MESSTPSSSWHGSEREIDGEIMRTDVFVRVLSEEKDQARMSADIDEVFALFRGFEARQSRFRKESELSMLNASDGGVVSMELFLLLSAAERYYEETGGLFDPSVLPVLVAEGYGGSYGTETFGIPGEASVHRHVFRELSLDPETRTVRKPRDLMIDLGGIGKGFVVDRVSEFLSKRYRHFFVCAGGDIRTGGKNVEAGYDFWAVDVENPIANIGSLATLLLSDKAVATSGTGRRKWKTDEGTKHHLIDPRTGKSANTDLASVTVVSETVERAEVLAKILCILGSEQGRRYAEEKRIPALFVSENGGMTRTIFMEPYVWKA